MNIILQILTLIAMVLFIAYLLRELLFPEKDSESEDKKLNNTCWICHRKLDKSRYKIKLLDGEIKYICPICKLNPGIQEFLVEEDKK